MDRARIAVFDTTLRDGEQSPGCSMNMREKMRIARQLDRLGVDVIEAGFPIASDGDFEAVQAIAAAVRRPTIAALARCCTPDIERAWEALKGAARAIVARVVGTASGSADSTRRGRARPKRRRSGAPSVFSTNTLSTSASADGLTR